MPAETEIPQPTFPLQAYGVELSWSGEEGAMVAKGHVPDLRPAAAVNYFARTVFAVRSALDDGADQEATLEDFLAFASHAWALPVQVEDEGYEWQVRTDGVTAETPGSFPMTIWDPT